VSKQTNRLTGLSRECR